MNYNIEGEPLPVVICNLEANETMTVSYTHLDVYKRQSTDFYSHVNYSVTKILR